MKISGNNLFVTAMKKEGVDTIFAYPGGMVVNLLDALHDCHGIDLVLPRHEQGLIHAADGYARATGKVGVCLVTSGPGATNLVTGIANANYDSIPLVCFTGQVPEHLIGNDAFQEVDIVGITRNVAKFVIMVRDREMLAQRIKEAFYIARSGKPGPVLVDLPTDVMAELGSTSYPTEVNIRGYKPNKGVHVGQLKKAIALLKEATKPIFLIGGGVNLAHAQNEMTTLAEKLNIPVITTVMGRGAISTEHPLFVGNIGMHGSYAANKAANECDLMFSIGCRFNDRVTGNVSKFAPNAKIVHIDIEAAAISRNVTVDIPIVADAKAAICKILEHTDPMNHGEWIEEVRSWDREHPLGIEVKTGVNPQRIIETLNEVYADRDTIFTSDVGQHQMWAAQYYKYKEPRTLITSGGLGTMGYGLGAAIGAKFGRPDKVVVNIAGDGCFRMNMNEVATAARNNLPLIEIVINNHVLGMVRQWQTLFYDHRYSSTILDDKVDFVKFAESMGAVGIRVTKKEEVGPAIEKAIALNTTVVLDCQIDCDDKVFPMVPAGAPIEEVFDAEDLAKKEK